MDRIDRTLRWKLLPLGLLLLLFGIAVGSNAGGAAPDSQETGAVQAAESESLATTSEPVVEVALGELRSDPARWLGSRVRFVFQLQELSQAWEPYLTRFGPTDWVGFSGWPDEAFTWDPTVFHDPATRLFARRAGELDGLLAEAEPFARFEATAWVRELFLDEPWIEIESLRPLYEKVGAGTILHVERAFEFVGRGQWNLGHEQLDRAAAAPVPPHVRAELTRIAEEWRAAQRAAEEKLRLTR